MASPFCPSKCPCPCTPYTCHCEHKNPCFLSDQNQKGQAIRNDFSDTFPVAVSKAMNSVPNDLPTIIKTKLQTIHVSFFSEATLPTDLGNFRIRVYTASEHPDFSFQPVALISGKIENSSNVPVRVHDQCFTSEVLGSKKCDCKEQLEYAKKYIKENGGMIIYLQQEGRGIGLANKIAAYHLQDGGKDTVEANRALGLQDDYRTYESVKQILEDLHISSIRLMTNNPYKKISLQQIGVKIDSIIPVIIPPNKYDIGYLHCKAQRMGHMLPLDGIPNFDNNCGYNKDDERAQ